MPRQPVSAGFAAEFARLSVTQFAWQGARLHLQSARPMSQQYNKVIKQRRRKAYLKRQKEARKQRAVKKAGPKPAAEATTPAA